MEYTKRKLEGMSPLKFATGNFQNAIANTTAVHNMNRENRREAREAMGVTEFEMNSIVQIGNVGNRIRKEDLAIRKSNNDSSTDLLGVVRGFNIDPDIFIEFATKPSLLYLGELSDDDKLAAAIDGTGNMYKLKGDAENRLIQHIVFSTQPKEALLSSDECALSQPTDMHLIDNAELVTTTTTHISLAKWLKKLAKDVLAATKSTFRRPVALRITLLRIDNAGQLANGAIVGLRRKGMIDSQKTYSVLAMAVFLRYEGAVAAIPAGNEYSQQIKSIAESSVKLR